MTKLPATWPMIPIGELFEMQLGKMLSEASKGGHSPRPYLANFNVQWRRFDLSEVQSMDFDDDEVSKFELRSGDILVCEGGEVGRSAIWRGEVPGCCYQKALHRLRPLNGSIDREYFVQFMEWAAAHGWFKRYTVSSSIAHLTRETLVDIEMPVPPPMEQAKIARVLGAVDKAVERSREVIAQTRTLRQALLHTLLNRGLPGRHTKFKTVRLGDIYAERSEHGIAGLPVMSVTNNGMVERSTTDRRVESDLPDEGHALVRKDDIAYNMMRMWQGVSCLADRDCLVSPAYVVCSPKKGIVPAYGAYLLKAPHVVHLLRLHSQGVHEDRLRLYYKHFAPIKVEIPDEDTQRSSVRMIASLDARLAAAETHLAALERVKSALSAALLTGEIRVPVDGLNAPAAAPTKGEVGHG